MAISFSDVPSGIRVPFAYVEFDDSRALQGPSLMPHELLVIAPRLAAGTVAELVPFVATNADQVRAKAGAGSIAHMMAKSLFQNNRLTKTTFVLQDISGTAAVHTITVSGTSTAAGTIALYIAGVRIQVTVATGLAAAAVAALIEAELDLEVADLSVTASVASAVVTCTAKNDGATGTDIDFRDSYYQGEELPAGISIAYANSTPGSGAPDISEVWAVLGEEHYTVWAVAYDDPTNLALLKTEMDDRANSLRQLGAVAIVGTTDTHANLLTFGAAQNSERISLAGIYSSPTPPWEWAAAAAGQTAESARNDPARPLQRLPLRGVLAPATADRFDLVERDLLLNDGVATYTIAADGLVRIERQITTFQTNASGAPSTAFLDIETPLTLEYLRYDFRNQLLTKYPRHKLASDGSRFGAGQVVLTPKTARAEAVNIARGWESLGLVEGIDQFSEDLIVERNLQDPNRLDFLLPPDLVNGARIFGVQIGFLL